jgi:hypothetical protein
LSDADRRGLSELLELYRKGDQGHGSTTTDRIIIEYFRGKERVGTEKIVTQLPVDQWVYERNGTGLIPADADRGFTGETVSFPDLKRRSAKG